MENENITEISEEVYTYWKKPWLKWVVLTAGLLQLPYIAYRLHQYQTAVRSGLLAGQELEAFLMNQKFGILLGVLCAVVLIGIFFAGSRVRSIRQSRLMEAVFLLLIAVAMTAALVLWGSGISTLMSWVILVMGLWAFGLLSLFQYLVERNKDRM